MEDRTEIRNTTFQVTANEDDEKRTVEGYALLFGVSADNLGFEEVIERGALDGVLGKSDVFALLNHDRSKGILARAKNGNGSLSLEVDSKGLKYRFEAPKTALGNELLENLRRGEIDQSSFAFTVADGGEKWERQKTGYGNAQYPSLREYTMCLRFTMQLTQRQACICVVKKRLKRNLKKEKNRIWKNITKELITH